MVSTNQSSGSSGTAINEAHRLLATDMEIAPMIRGVEDVDRIILFWNTVNNPDLNIKYRERRRKMIQERMAYLKERKD